ncbi:hypothetical protein LMA_06041 [Liquorilactobacillus mali KCTC 3596 = DSM 20444]|nr:hypothetical protein LMA_06041 [Liquorilactobacillus mali KCTC 3596 = DSM 20444]
MILKQALSKCTPRKKDQFVLYAVSPASIHNWIKDARSVEPDDETEITPKELKKLQKRTTFQGRIGDFKSCSGVTEKAYGRVKIFVFAKDQFAYLNTCNFKISSYHLLPLVELAT